MHCTVNSKRSVKCVSMSKSEAQIIQTVLVLHIKYIGRVPGKDIRRSGGVGKGFSSIEREVCRSPKMIAGVIFYYSV